MKLPPPPPTDTHTPKNMTFICPLEQSFEIPKNPAGGDGERDPQQRGRGQEGSGSGDRKGQ